MSGKIINKFSIILGAFASIITILFTIVDYLDDVNILIKLLIIGIIVVFISIYFNERDIELIKPKYIKDPQKIDEFLINCLKDTKKSLYYFGGAGFINANDIWAETLANKLRDPEFKVVRIIDLKKPDELEPLLRRMYGEEVYDKIEDYRRWIKTHAKHLKEEDIINNAFYSYEGAPIWKHGMNYIVFDKKILVLITPIIREGSTPNIRERRKVVVISNHNIAEEFADSIKLVIEQFKLDKLSGEDLVKVYHKDKTE